MENKLTAEQILENIFDIMQRLYNEMRLNKDDENKHLQIFEIFAELGSTLAGADRASFWMWDKKNHRLLTTAAMGTSQIIIDDTTGLVGRAISENRTIVTNDPYNHPDFNAEVDKKTGYITKSVLVLPVANCRGEIIGAFQAINKLGSSAGFDEPADTKRLSIAAFICGMALESDLFLADSQHDKLTQLKNRVGMQNDFKTRYEKILRAGNPMAMIMCDIDFFKRVNDTYGHNAGDEILRHVSKIFLDKNNNGDAYRWGGEEFILIVENASLAEAKIVAEQIRLTIMNSTCNFEGKEIHVTMSFGVSEISAALSMEDNVKIVDERLYRAKEAGRNRVIAD